MHTYCIFKELHNCTIIVLIYHLGGQNVLANVTASDRNADQPIFDDITDTLRDDWLQIWDNFTDAQRTAVIDRFPLNPISRNGWITEQIPFFRAMLEVLSCRVVSKDVCMHNQ